MWKLTSIKVDSDLIEKAMKIIGTKTKRATVVEALERETNDKR